MDRESQSEREEGEGEREQEWERGKEYKNCRKNMKKAINYFTRCYSTNEC